MEHEQQHSGDIHFNCFGNVNKVETVTVPAETGDIAANELHEYGKNMMDKYNARSFTITNIRIAQNVHDDDGLKPAMPVTPLSAAIEGEENSDTLKINVTGMFKDFRKKRK
jgi:hypothetical protein